MGEMTTNLVVLSSGNFTRCGVSDALASCAAKGQEALLVLQGKRTTLNDKNVLKIRSQHCPPRILNTKE